MSNELKPIEFDYVGDGEPVARSPSTTPRARVTRIAKLFAVGFAAAALLVGAAVLVADDRAAHAPGEAELAEIVASIPRPLLSAERFAAVPGGESLRELIDSIGGLDGLTGVAADGAFDLVRFDPLDHDRLLASTRLSYGPAENEGVNEVWRVADGDVEQTVWAADISHDFVHFNDDGTVTMWVHGGGDGFAPRVAHLLTNDFEPIVSTEAMHASRFAAADGTVFALTGNGDYYSNDGEYVDLIADDGTTTSVLAAGAPFGWIDTPSPGLLVAYPASPAGVTRVWDTATLAPIAGHSLAGRPYVRAAVSGDGSTALSVTLTGEIEVLDLLRGDVTGSFGDVDVQDVDRPITVNDDGSTAITVERDGVVTVWWVADGAAVLSVAGDSAQPRWLREEFAARSSSAVAPDASRVALRLGARPGEPVQWVMLDTDVASWIDKACELAGRGLTTAERSALGLGDGPAACGS